jgi:hypothetical protein
LVTCYLAVNLDYLYDKILKLPDSAAWCKTKSRIVAPSHHSFTVKKIRNSTSSYRRVQLKRGIEGTVTLSLCHQGCIKLCATDAARSTLDSDRVSMCVTVTAVNSLDSARTDSRALLNLKFAPSRNSHAGLYHARYVTSPNRRLNSSITQHHTPLRK